MVKCSKCGLEDSGEPYTSFVFVYGSAEAIHEIVHFVMNRRVKGKKGVEKMKTFYKRADKDS